MNYPIEKYKIIVHDHEVIAISTYAGKTVRGVAKADPRDEFDVEVGKELAIARCAAKIAIKRQNRAKRCLATAQARLAEAQAWVDKMSAYASDSMADASKAVDTLYEVEQKLK